jgi:hypothetical protein
MLPIEETVEIAVPEAIPGMQVAEAVHDEQGVFLVTRDTILTDKHIASLKQHGIERLVIVRPAKTEENTIILAETLTRLSALFRHHHDSTANMVLQERLRQYRIRNTR